MSSSALKTRVCSLDSLSNTEAGLWDKLHLEDPVSSAFMSRHFAISVAAVHPNVKVAILSTDGHPIAFFPFQFADGLSRRLGAAEPIGGHLSDYFGVIASKTFTTTPTQLLKHCGLSSLQFTHLDETQLQYGLSGRKEGFGIRYVIKNKPEEYWAYIRKSDKKFHADTFRQERRIEREMGPLRLQLNVDTCNCHQMLDKLITLKQEKYKATGVPNVFNQPWTRLLLHKLLDQQQEGCTGVLSALYAGDTVVSLHFGLQCKDRLHFWFPAYFEQANRFSPGRMMLKALIDQLGEHNIVCLDDGEARIDQQQKLIMGNEKHYYYSDFWVQPNLSAKLARSRQALNWRLAHLKRNFHSPH